eukprot:7065959-Prorocentrum_lima.AAC.1
MPYRPPQRGAETTTEKTKYACPNMDSSIFTGKAGTFSWRMHPSANNSLCAPQATKATHVLPKKP